jgi:RNA polymerase sigma factor (sigma-70 family)
MGAIRMTASAARAGTRDDRAFEELYGSYAQNVYRYVFAVLGKQADAEDTTQQTFLNAYRALRRGERPEQPERWLITIAHNACRERYRYAQRRPREVSLDEAMTIAGFESESAPTADELKQALLVLPETQRSALLMRELEGRSYAETAAALRISSTALGTLLFRARESLREQLEEPLSCSEAEHAIATQLEGTLPAVDKRLLRAHLRKCDACAVLARSRRARKRPFEGLLSLPSWLVRTLPNLVGGGAPATGVVGGLAVKAAAVVALGTVFAGGVYAQHAHVVAMVDSHTTHLPLIAHPVNVSNQTGRRESPHEVTPERTASGHAVSSQARPESAGVAPAADPTAPSTEAGATTTQAPVQAAPVDTTPTITTGASTSGSGAETAAAETQTETAGSSGNVPPGQAKKDATTDATSTADTSTTLTAGNSGNVPPGQAKKDSTTDATSTADTSTTQTAGNSGNVPPGQAKKDATTDTTSTTNTTTTDTTTTVADTAGNSGNVPPGQGKKNGGH